MKHKDVTSSKAKGRSYISTTMAAITCDNLILCTVYLYYEWFIDGEDLKVIMM